MLNTIIFNYDVCQRNCDIILHDTVTLYRRTTCVNNHVMEYKIMSNQQIYNMNEVTVERQSIHNHYYPLILLVS